MIINTLNNHSAKGRKSLAALVDPDKTNQTHIKRLAEYANNRFIDYFFVGGSLLTSPNLSAAIRQLKQSTSIPVVLFPGSTMQVDSAADAILFLSLISGRNAELLIGKHVEVAPFLNRSNLEIISTGYMLIDCGKPTSASYMSNTNPIPYDKPDIAACTALAGEMLGLKSIYLEAGSGALNTVPLSTIKMVRETISVPLIVGGGIRDGETARVICEAGADVIVVGTQIESNPDSIPEISEAIQYTNVSL